jgi:hypothetical protein
MMPDYGWFSFANKIDRPDLVSPVKLGIYRFDHCLKNCTPLWFCLF